MNQYSLEQQVHNLENEQVIVIHIVSTNHNNHIKDNKNYKYTYGRW
jgi:hypothetical protein